MASESIAHEAEGRMGHWLRAHSGSRNNFLSIDLGIPVKKTSLVTVFLYFELHRSIMNILEEKKQGTIKIEWSNWINKTLTGK